mmetsp:Transcript_22338/g.26885  ORF Transcript_22338/g.26885 Transcript_22338/m.26885 type:complete len:451 (+) Transcript_22338:231-1583(+)
MSDFDEGLEDYDELIRLATRRGEHTARIIEIEEEGAPTTGSTQGAYSLDTTRAHGESEDNSETTLSNDPPISAPTPLRKTIGSSQARAGEQDATVTEALRRSMGGAPSSTDMDIDIFAYEMEDHWRALKKDAVDRFLESKKKAALHEKNMVEAERRHGLNRLAAKQQELEVVQEQLVQEKIRLGKQQEYLESACVLVSKKTWQVNAWTAMGYCWHTWQVYTAFERRLKFHSRLAANKYCKTLLRHAVQSWRQGVRIQVKINTEARHAAEMQQLRDNLTNHFKDTINDLQDRLAAANSRIAQEEAMRAELEKNMKQAFMRGVCALNIEAMAVMKRGTGIAAQYNENQDSNPGEGGGDGDTGGEGGGVGEDDDVTTFINNQPAAPQQIPQPVVDHATTVGYARPAGASIRATPGAGPSGGPVPRDVSAYPRPIATSLRPKGPSNMPFRSMRQ